MIILTIFAFFIFAFLPPSVHAQQKNQRWTCLQIKSCKDLQTDPKCTEYTEQGSEWMRYLHSAKIDTMENASSKPLPNAKTNIVEEIQIPDWIELTDEVKAQFSTDNPIPTEVKTTGNSEIDKEIFNGNDNLALLTRLFSKYAGPDYPGYINEGFYQTDLKTLYTQETNERAIVTNADGNFPSNNTYIYVSHVLTSPKSVEHKLMAVNLFTIEPTPTPTPMLLTDGSNSNGNESGNQSGTQIGTFYSFQAPLVASSSSSASSIFASNLKSCVKIAWDPYGTVFDGLTLEPIKGATVTLVRKNADGSYTNASKNDSASGYLTNPLTTLDDGKYSFVVVDGTYRVLVSATGYTYPNDPTKYKTNSIYSNVYRGEDIIEKGRAIEANIPIDANNSTTFLIPFVKTANAQTQNTLPRVMGVFVRNVGNGKVIVDGSVSHPLSYIRAYCKDTNNNTTTLNTSIQADKKGDFILEFDQTKCKTGDMFGILIPEKIDLTTLASLQQSNSWLSQIKELLHVPQVQAATVRGVPRVYNPIFNSIDGYAKDSAGAPLAKSTVEVYEYGATKPYYKTQADLNGHVTIASNNLPQWGYSLKYVTPVGKTIPLNTTNFVKQNKTYLTSKNINLYTKTSSRSSTQSKKGQTNRTLALNNSRSSSSSNNTSTGTQQMITKNSNQTAFVIIIILMISLGGAFVVAFVIFTKKNQTPTY